jgi:hypothetical protein
MAVRSTRFSLFWKEFLSLSSFVIIETLLESDELKMVLRMNFAEFVSEK